jgi:hypothetical protein
LGDFRKRWFYNFLSWRLSGNECEAGLIVNAGSFIFSVGASSQSFKRLDGDFSIGFAF